MEEEEEVENDDDDDNDNYERGIYDNDIGGFYI